MAAGSTSIWISSCRGQPATAGPMPVHSHDEKRQPTARTTSASPIARTTASPPMTPPWPKKRGSAVEITPSPIWVAVAAAPSVAASARSSCSAPDSAAPPPAMISGRRARESSPAASSTAAGSAGERPVGRKRSSGASSSAGSNDASARSTSIGISRCVGPGRPVRASRSAQRTSCGIRSGERATPLQAVTGAKSRSLSLSMTRPWCG